MKLLATQLANLIKIPRIGQTGDSKVTLSMKVKQAIFSSLKDNCLALSPRTTTLGRYELFDILSYTCQLPTNAHVILIWHIATSVCEDFFKSQPKDDHFEVATQLSKYCAYLLNFSPELLPDHLYTTESVFDQAVSGALVIFMGPRIEKRFNKMTSMSEEDDRIVVKGVVLGNKLKDVIRDPSKGWKVLAEFWAELLLYMTPSDNIDKTNAHGQHLAQGGEFITHLWTLLTHAGVLDRPSNDSFMSTI